MLTQNTTKYQCKTLKKSVRTKINKQSIHQTFIKESHTLNRKIEVYSKTIRLQKLKGLEVE